MTSVTIPARPEPVAIDTQRAAVLVVDMQNDFCAPGGMFDRGGLDIAVNRRAIAPIARVLAAARAAGLRVAYLQMGFRPDLSDLGAPDSVNRLRHLRFGVGVDGVLVRDTWHTAVIPELAPQPGDIAVYKSRFSGFFETELHARLQESGIRDLVVTGCTTSVCVEATLRDAMYRDYRCVLPADCVAEPIGDGAPRSNHDASLLVAELLLGWVSTADDVAGALTAASRPCAS